MPSNARILVVDDHQEMARLLADSLSDLGHSVKTATSGNEAIAIGRAWLPDVVVTDLRMEQVDGLDVMRAMHDLDATIAVIIMTAFGGIDAAVEAVKGGAFHFVVKPFKLDEVGLWVKRALIDRRLKEENRALRKIARSDGFAGLAGSSQRMQQLYDLVERAAQSSVPVLIRGESGTGKDLVARALHFQGPRAERPFVAVNCTALPDALLESELFGHLKGSFTGATTARRGLFVQADTGTLFLDEIGDMPANLQAKLLRVLEDGCVRAVGADEAKRVDVRVLAATHQDLEARVKAGTFRADLYYRLHVVPVDVPALREHPEDIPALLQLFLERALARSPRSLVRAFAPEVITQLCRCAWPGNVRELENLVERLVVVVDSAVIDDAALKRHAPALGVEPSPLQRAQETLMPLRQLEAEYIAYVVRHCEGNKTRAAELLGIDVSTIHRQKRSDA
jgi:two-component system response regulator HydG